LPRPARVGILRGVPLSWNEIRHRAITFAKEWKGETREAAERQTFWNEFFNVFGVRRRTVATFEEPVKKLSGDWGFIDLFWPGRLLAEHKSAGLNVCGGCGLAPSIMRTTTMLTAWTSSACLICSHDCRPVPLNVARLLSFTCCPKTKSMARALEANLVRGGAGVKKACEKVFSVEPFGY
jgi:hypothetical protein